MVALCSLLFLGGCSANRDEQTISTMETSQTSETSHEEDDFTLAFVESTEDSFRFMLKNHTDTEYLHIMTDDDLTQYVANNWEPTVLTKSANYMSSPLAPHSETEITIPHANFEKRSHTFKLTVHLKNDTFGERYLETIFEVE